MVRWLSHEYVVLLEIVCRCIGGFCVLLAGLVSTYQIGQHWLQRYSSRSIQKSIMLIIGFVIWYSFCTGYSMFAEEVNYATTVAVLKIVREVYESTTVLAFVNLLIHCMGGKGEIRYHIELNKQHPKHPLAFGSHIARRHISDEGACFRRRFGRIYRPGISMITTNMVGILQFAFVSIFIILAQTAFVVVYNEIYEQEEPALISKLAQAVNVVSSTVAMYQVSMLSETLEENNGLREKYEALDFKFKLRFLNFLFKVSWIDGICQLGVQFFKSEQKKEIFWANFFTSLLMVFFAMLHWWAFPTGQLIAVQDCGGKEHCWQIVRMLKDIQNFRELHQNRTSCLEALIGFHNAATYLDLSGDGKIEKAKLRYLFDTAGIERSEADKLFADMGDETALDLRRFFPHWRI